MTFAAVPACVHKFILPSAIRYMFSLLLIDSFLIDSFFTTVGALSPADIIVVPLEEPIMIAPLFVSVPESPYALIAWTVLIWSFGFLYLKLKILLVVSALSAV
jgi:hypothetical protein